MQINKLTKITVPAPHLIFGYLDKSRIALRLYSKDDKLEHRVSKIEVINSVLTYTSPDFSPLETSGCGLSTLEFVLNRKVQDNQIVYRQKYYKALTILNGYCYFHQGTIACELIL